MLLTVDNQIDPATGTVKLKAEFPNTDGALFPNQFVNVRMLLDTRRGVTAIPVAAIQRGSARHLRLRRDSPSRPSRCGRSKSRPSRANSAMVESGRGAGERRRRRRRRPAARRRQGRCRRARSAAARARSRRESRRQTRPAAARARGSRAGHESVAAVHPAAGRDLAADGRRSCSPGIVAYRLLPLSALPEVDYPTIQVVTFYPGASPDVMTSSVTAPLERQFGQMPGLKQMSSTSSGGASVITLQFDLDLTLDVAEQEVQAAINAAGNLLPADLPAPPIYSKVNPADAPILTLGAHLDDAAAAGGRRTWPTRGSRRRSRSSPASAWSASAAGSGRRCASRSTRRRSPPTA